MRTGFIGWHILQEGMHYRRTCVRGDYFHCLSVQLFINVVFMLVWLTSCKHDWCSSSFSFWCLSVSLVNISVRHDCCVENFPAVNDYSLNFNLITARQQQASK